jgi:hypothetical protein
LCQSPQRTPRGFGEPVTGPVPLVPVPYASSDVGLFVPCEIIQNILYEHLYTHLSEKEIQIIVSTLDPLNRKFISLYEFVTHIHFVSTFLITHTPLPSTGVDIAHILLSSTYKELKLGVIKPGSPRIVTPVKTVHNLLNQTLDLSSGFRLKVCIYVCICMWISNVLIYILYNYIYL